MLYNAVRIYAYAFIPVPLKCEMMAGAGCNCILSRLLSGCHLGDIYFRWRRAPTVLMNPLAFEPAQNSVLRFEEEQGFHRHSWQRQMCRFFQEYLCALFRVVVWCQDRTYLQA